MESWLYDLQALYSVTLTGQYSLLMLIEEFELNGIRVISANSDGVTTYFHKDKKVLKDEIVKRWQELTNFEIETVAFEKFYYSTVNDYFAIKKGYYEAEDKKDYLKFKGDIAADTFLYQNKSWRVVALAVQEYFKNGTSPVDFIKSHKNIYDFCIMARATGQLYLEFQNSEGETKRMKKLIRYYLCKDSDWELYKRGIGTTGKPANISSHAANEVGQPFVRYFNQYVEMEDYQIDYNQYIYKSLKIISKIEKSDKLKQFINSVASKQISMF